MMIIIIMIIKIITINMIIKNTTITIFFDDASNEFCVFKLVFQCLAPCIIPEIEFGEVIPLLSSLNIFTNTIFFSKNDHIIIKINKSLKSKTSGNSPPTSLTILTNSANINIFDAFMPVFGIFCAIFFLGKKYARDNFYAICMSVDHC